MVKSGHTIVGFVVPIELAEEFKKVVYRRKGRYKGVLSETIVELMEKYIEGLI